MRPELTKALVDEYVERTPRSREAHGRLARVLPGGQTRSIVHFEPYPVMLVSGTGPRVVDADGHEYLDVLNNYTALVHGHRHPEVTAAVRTALESGTVFPAPHDSQLRLAEHLVGRLGAAERVRFTNSGSEATVLALRIARAATGRRPVVAIEGGYHGSVPEFVDGSPELVRVPYNDLGAAAAAIDTSIAAVIVEPFLGCGGVVPAAPGYLAGLAKLAAGAGALFVLDEVQSLRNACRGVHGELGLAPDLVLLGKIIGGGFPVGAVAGRADLLDRTDARRPDALSHAGTFNGNVVTTAAGLVALELLDADAIAGLNGRAVNLAAAIEAAARRAGVAAVVTHSGSVLHVHLAGERPTAAVELNADAVADATALHLALLLEGVYAAPRGMLDLSTPMTNADLAEVAAAYGRAFDRLAELTASDRAYGATSGP